MVLNFAQLQLSAFFRLATDGATSVANFFFSQLSFFDLVKEFSFTKSKNTSISDIFHLSRPGTWSRVPPWQQDLYNLACKKYARLYMRRKCFLWNNSKLFFNIARGWSVASS